MTEAKLAANRANALKSTGPTSPGGKAASSRNSVVHGLCAEKLVLVDGEDSASVEARRAVWVGALAGECPVAAELADKSFRALLRSRRCERKLDVVIASRVRRAEGNHDVKRAREVEAAVETFRDAPRVGLPTLRLTSEGCRRLAGLHHDAIRDLDRWEVDRRTVDLVRDLFEEDEPTRDHARGLVRAVALFVVHCGTFLPGRPVAKLAENADGKAFAGKNFGIDLEESRTQALAAAAELRALIESARLALLERAGALEPLSELDRAEAADQALMDPSDDVERLARRYLAEADRELHRCRLAALAAAETHRARQAAPAPVAETEAEVEAAPTPIEPEAPARNEAKAETPARNEAKASVEVSARNEAKAGTPARNEAKAPVEVSARNEAKAPASDPRRPHPAHDPKPTHVPAASPARAREAEAGGRA